jgi:hypothetical protein
MVVDAVCELLAAFGSGVALVTVAVLLMNEPFGALVFKFRTKLIDVVPAVDEYVGAMQVTVPVAPGSGVEHVKKTPDVEIELNVVFGGSASVTVTV